MTTGIRRRLVRLRYRTERYFYLLLVVVLPIAAIGGLIVIAYLAMTRELGATGAVALPPVVAEAWAIIDPYLSPEAEVIFIGTLILAVLVLVAWIADRYTEE